MTNGSSLLAVETINVARLAVMGIIGLLLGLTALIVLRYGLLVYHGHRGVLPVHVVSIATSYLILCCFAGRTLWERYQAGGPATWRIYAAGAAAVIGLFALATLLSHVWALDRRRGKSRYCPECGNELE